MEKNVARLIAAAEACFVMFLESRWHAINNKSEPPLIRGEMLADDREIYGEVHAAFDRMSCAPFSFSYSHLLTARK